MAQGFVEKAVEAAQNLGNMVMGTKGEAPRGEAANPANTPASITTGKDRIPLSVPQMKLEMPEIPGFVCQWFVDRPGRIQRALRAGFEFVSPDEIGLNVSNVANDRGGSGSTYLGSSRVSLFGEIDSGGKALDQFLMKQKREFYDADQKVREDRNEQVAKALRGGYDVQGNPHDSAADQGTRTVGQFGGGKRVKMPELFIPRHLRRNFKAKG